MSKKHYERITYSMLAALDESQAALDVLAGDIEDLYPARAQATADLAMRVRTAIRQAKELLK